MKKVIIIIMIMVTAGIIMTGCSKKETKNQKKTGGWQTTVSSLTSITGEEKAIFDEAKETYKDLELTPTVLIGKQVVSGTNYMFLCKSKTVSNRPVTSWKIVIVYQDAKGKSKITTVKDFNVTDYAGKNKTIKSTKISGGWEINEEAREVEIAGDIKRIFPREVESKETKTNYNPIVVLGKQIVSGTNYAILCTEKQEGNETSKLSVVTLYVNLEAVAEITHIANINLADFNK